MKPITLILICLFLHVGLLNAQSSGNYTVKEGPYFKTPNSFVPHEPEPIGTDGAAIYFRVGNYKRTNLEKGIPLFKYDMNMKLIKSNVTAFPKLRQASELVDVIMHQGRLQAIYSFYNYAEKKDYLFMQEIDKKTLELSGSSKLLLQVDLEDMNGFDRSRFRMNYSEDSSSIIIWYRIYGRAGAMVSGYTTYTEDFTEISKVEKIDFLKGHMVSINDMVIDNDANVYISYRSYPKISGSYDTDMRVKCSLGRGKITQTRGVFENLIVRVDKELKAKEFELQIEGMVPYWAYITPLKQGGILCSGLFTKHGEASPRGSYSTVINSKSPSTITITNIKTFSVDFIKQGLDPEDAETMQKHMDDKEDFDIYDYTFKGIIRAEAGEFIVPIERHCFYTFTRNQGNYVTEVPVHRYSFILLLYFSDSGEYLRTVKVPRLQDSNFDNWVGFTHTVINGELSLLYNENTDGAARKVEIVRARIGKDYKISTQRVESSTLLRYGAPQFHDCVWADKTTCCMGTYSNMRVPNPVILKLPGR